jgi:hypothetical protein
MGLLVLFGTGLFGIVLSVGTYVVGNSDPASGRFLDPLARIAKFAVPVVLVLLGLHATYDLVDLSTQIVDKLAQNVESIPCRISFLFSSG